MELQVTSDIRTVSAGAWNALTGSANPFLRHEFLATLEEYGAVGDDLGWSPCHLLLRSGDALLAAAPAYLKSHSWGEFVFDFAWADAYERHGRQYYPKLVIAVPWTPATGPRVLTQPDMDGDALAGQLLEAAREWAQEADISSVHCLFLTQRQAEIAERSGYQGRVGCQYHWHNHDYPDFEAFLGALTAKRRKNIRRERRLVQQAGVQLRAVHGHEATPSLWRAMHQFYRSTFRERGNIPVLSAACFQALGERLGWRVVLFVAEREGEPVAAALCLRDEHCLYGRYWGCAVTVDALHFEACYYQGIEYCIRHGLQRFDPGAQGEHKVPRGFVPVLTHSAHHLRDTLFREAVAEFLGRERAAVMNRVEALTMASPYRESG